ncbi:hypothetical protein N7481_007440 [Penicillium waksmanii]|uniref:uncharacterized protein n=1 Tax=Penicillium waksmanii TaxID=69791 RepID=UPI00254808EC|nr:uncharacterized protein N7481_007440 [Penicillium waksmanii]KAJ5980142.1 hypothetical protein N7481_007440 [Penicillium waksmanii]
MASIVIDELENHYENDPRVGIAYIFCSFHYSDDSRQSPENILANMIRQLIRRHPLLPSTVQLLYKKHRTNGSRPSFHELCKAFKDVVQMALKQVFIVIDAFDECKAATISRIISQVFETQSFGNLDVLATSRSVPAIEARFQDKRSQEIRATKEDVMKYPKARLGSCEGCALIRRPALQEKAVLVIVGSVMGMFFLAQLYLDSLISAPGAKEINNVLERLIDRSNRIDRGNTAVDDAYRDVVERIKNQDPRRQTLAKDALSWVICARRPLTTLELRTTLTIELGESDLNEEDRYDLEDIISSCAGLITVGSDSTKEMVQLAHYTMQEYFTRNQAVFFPDAEKTITASCLTYLSYDIFHRGMCSNDIQYEAQLSQYPLYSYAAISWGHHARVYPIIDDLLLPFLRNTSILDDASVQALFSLKGYHGVQSYCLRIPMGFTAVHLAAWFGLENTLRYLINQCDLTCARDSMNRDPLAWAASNGHTPVVKLLLDHGVDSNQHDEDGQTPISLAALNGCTEVVKLFLDHNINPYPIYIGSKVPLVEASYRQHQETVELLLNRGAYPDPEDMYGRTPFMWACYNGSIEIV